MSQTVDLSTIDHYYRLEEPAATSTVSPIWPDSQLSAELLIPPSPHQAPPPKEESPHPDNQSEVSIPFASPQTPSVMATPEPIPTSPAR